MLGSKCVLFLGKWDLQGGLSRGENGKVELGAIEKTTKANCQADFQGIFFDL